MTTHFESLITDHARFRMQERSLPKTAVRAALAYGRKIHVRGTVIRAIGRKEVEHFGRKGLDLSPFEGIQVLCSPGDGSIITAYRNHDFRGLRPNCR